MMFECGIFVRSKADWQTPRSGFKNSSFYHCDFGLRHMSLQNCQLTKFCVGVQVEVSLQQTTQIVSGLSR